MPASFVALEIVHQAAERYEITAVVAAAGGDRHLSFLLGHDPAAAQARARGMAGEVTIAADWNAIAQGLLDAADEVPWITFDAAESLEAWRAVDGTGALVAVPQLDVGDLLAVACPLVRGRALEDFLAAAGLGDARPARGRPTAEAIAALWRAAPPLIAARPFALRQGVLELLQQVRHPLAAAWASGAGGDRAADEPTLLDTLLRQRLRALTPAAAEPAEPPECRPIDLAEVAGWFAPGGPIAALMHAYEERPGQVAMARGVAAALNGGQCLLVEAGTGTGKSLAYLAPALKFAVANQTPVVVSTNTKNLQDQLCRKDLPLLREALDFEFRAELVKGRANYLCVEKLLREHGDANLLPFDDQPFYLAAVLSWACETTSGDLDDLSGYLTARHPKLEGFVRGLASDSDTCTAPGSREHPCFATVARRRAAEADLLVVNHALALANATIEVLPPYRHLILDEAHNLEDIATDQFGLGLERRTLLRLAREVGASRDQRAFTNRCRKLIDEAGGLLDPGVLEELTELERAASEVMSGAEDFGQQLGGVVMRRQGRALEDLVRVEKLRLLPAVWNDALGQSLQTAGQNLRARITNVAGLLTKIATGLQQVLGEGRPSGETVSSDLQQMRVQVQAAAQEWTGQAAVLDVLLDLTDEQYVYWLEFVLRRDAWEWKLRAAPIDAGAALANHLYSQKTAVVLTSATLTVAGRFDYFARRLGLHEPGVTERFESLQVPSTFDYDRQVLLAMPDNIALPHDERFESHVVRAIEDVVRILDGRTLILFTAVGSMRRAHEALADRLKQIGLEALCQGISGSRHALADRFRQNEHSVLFGTRSFWEGIDVPGDALQCVMIVKLPFAVPDEPVVEARCERLKDQGLDPWHNYSMPQAVILFKQGFGRLIRSATDRGVVVVLDRRLREKAYGKAFLRSVPGYHGVFDSWAEVKERVREWFDPSRPPAGDRRPGSRQRAR